MRRSIKIIAKLLLLYAFLGFIIIPAGLHFALYSLSPRYLAKPLSVGAVRFNPFTLNLSVQAVQLGDSDSPLVTFHELDINASWLSVINQAVVLDYLDILDPIVDIRLLKDGQVNLAQLVKKKSTSGDNGEPDDDKSGGSSEGSALAVSLASFTVVNGDVSFTDETNTGDQAFKEIFDQISVEGTSLSWPETSGHITFHTRINESGLLKTSSSFGAGSQVASDIELTGFYLPDLQPYISPITYLQVESGCLSGRVGLEGRLNNLNEELSVVADIDITDLQLDDERSQKTIFGWKQLAVTGLTYNQNEINVAEIAMDTPEGRVEIDQNQKLNLASLIKPQISDETSAAEVDKANSEALSAHIELLKIRDGLLNFSDTSFNPGFSAPISNLAGEISNIDTRSNIPVKVQFDGTVDSYSPVSVTGEIIPADPFKGTSIQMDFSDVELTTLTPYAGRFAGYTIHKGRMDLNLDYSILDSQLDARNRVVLKQLTLGEKVDSDKATSLPLRLAIALLKDSEGRIDIDLPVSGDLDNPEFQFGPVIRTAVINFITNIVSAPFKLLASLVSGDADEMSSVVFLPGESKLTGRHSQSMEKLVGALIKRPELTIEVEGKALRTIDASRVAEQAVKRAVMERYIAVKAKAGRVLKEPVVVPKRQQAKLLLALFEEQNIELDKSLTLDELYQALNEVWPVSDIELRALAIERAKAIKDLLVAKGLEARRVYILDAAISEPEPELELEPEVSSNSKPSGMASRVLSGVLSGVPSTLNLTAE